VNSRFLDVPSVWAIDDPWTPNTWAPPGTDEWSAAGGNSWRHEPSGAVLWWQPAHHGDGSLRLAA
jgi:hypothetical protein